MADNWNVPYVNPTTTLSPKKANEDAFYATAMSGSENPLAVYQSASTDLQQTGKSDFVDQQRAQWEQEDKVQNEQVMRDIISDKTIPIAVKKAVAETYSLTDYIPSTLKDRYIKKVASTPVQNTIDDNESQEANIEVLGSNIETNKSEHKKNSIFSGSFDIFNIMARAALPAPITSTTEELKSKSKATLGVTSSILATIPAGVAGLFALIEYHDSAKATEVMRNVQNIFTYTPEDQRAQMIQQNIVEAATTIGIPAQEIGDYVNTTLGKVGAGEKLSAAIATTAQIVLDPVNWFLPALRGVSKGTNHLSGIYTRMGTPKVPLDSPLETTNIANPQVAESLASAAIKDSTEQTASSLGVNKGQIVHDWILPKLMPEEILNTHPDLKATLAKNDEMVMRLYDDYRYDPSVIEATKREEEVARVFQIMKESRDSYYNQSLSLIEETNTGFKGNAVFSRNENYGWPRKADAQEAYNTLKTEINKLPEDQRGEFAIVKYNNQYYLNWQWNRQFDDLSTRIFGGDSVKASLFNGKINLDWLARSWASRGFFATGKFPKWAEFGALVNTEKTATIEAGLIKNIRENIVSSPYKKELDFLVNKAEEEGIDYFSPADISGFFPEKTSKQIDGIFETHSYWRRAVQYEYNFMNRVIRNKLAADQMQGIYDRKGNFVGAGTQNIPSTAIDGIKVAWDMDSNTAKVVAEEVKSNPNKILVRLNEKVEENGKVYHYALIGKEHQLNLLPKEVLNRIPGYSPRSVKESWYVDVVPTKLEIDGVVKYDKPTLNNYVKTKAAARTETEANKIKAQLESSPDYAGYEVVVRPERTENFGRVMSDYSIHSEYLTHALKRGERLPSINGLARIEDRAVSLVDSIRNVSRQNAWQAYNESFKSAFVKGYGDLTKGEFPQYSSDISYSGPIDRAMEAKLKSAKTLFKWYERMNNFETWSDFQWTSFLHGTASVFDKWKVPAVITDKLHGSHTNPLMVGKKVTTTAYIYMNPIRQWLIQPAQQFEMMAINPKSAYKIANNIPAIGMYLGADTQLMSSVSPAIKAAAQKLGEMAGNKEFLADVEAIRYSGLVSGVDMNSVVHGVFKNVDRKLVEGNIEGFWNDFKTMAASPVKLSKTAGYDAAELSNRIGNWLQAKDLWLQKNPGKNWKTKEAQTEIAAEGLRLSGAMNRAGMFNYQEGMLSIPFQFAAIQHKLFMNLIQDNTTILSPAERTQLAAARFALMGGKYGIPGGVLAYYYIEKSSDPEVRKVASIAKKGLIDRTTNGLIGAMVEPDEKPDLAVSAAISPYSKTGLPYMDFAWEAYKQSVGQPSDLGRFPSFSLASTFADTLAYTNSWFQTKEVTKDNLKVLAYKASELASSGMSNYHKGLLMLGVRDRVTKMGNKYGLDFVPSEAYAKMFFGINTMKEEDLWNLVQQEREPKQRNKELAQFIYRNMQTEQEILQKPGGTDLPESVSAYLTLMPPEHFSTQDKLDVIEQVRQLDRKRYTSTRESVMMDAWRRHQTSLTEETKAIDQTMMNSSDPNIRKMWTDYKKGY